MALSPAGLCVLDSSNVLAGPFYGYQLGLLGTEVIKIKVPSNGDLTRHLGADPEQARREAGTPFVAANAGKQSVTVNLKHPEGRTILPRLVAQADALIENYRPGMMDRLEPGCDVLREVNPRLVYCVISGFDKDGPLSGRPAYNQTIQGISDVMSITGDNASAPLRVGYPINDTVGGITTALVVATYLLGTQRTGQDCMVDVPTLESTLTTIGWVISNYLNTSVTPRPIGNQNSTTILPGTFRTDDGLINVVASEDKQFAALYRVVGHPEFAADARLAERYACKEYRQQLSDVLEAAPVARSAAEQEPLLIEAGALAGLVLDVPGVLAHEQVTGRGSVTAFPEAGQCATCAGLRLLDEDPCPQTPAPIFFARTDDWPARSGHRHDQIEALRTEGAI